MTTPVAELRDAYLAVGAITVWADVIWTAVEQRSKTASLATQ